jgi:hypothetical protein
MAWKEAIVTEIKVLSWQLTAWGKSEKHEHLGHDSRQLGGNVRYLTNYFIYPIKKKFLGLNPRANYIDRATAACRRSDCQILRIKGATWSAWRISRFSRQEPLLFYLVPPQLQEFRIAEFLGSVRPPLFTTRFSNWVRSDPRVKMCRGAHSVGFVRKELICHWKETLCSVAGNNKSVDTQMY